MNTTGYLHPLYARSLSEFGEPLELPACKGWILKRSIAETSEFDGMGCYPIFACQDWSMLNKDLDAVGDRLVSLSLVTDPFGRYDQKDLARCFGSLARYYKEHFVVDLQKRPEDFVAAHHQRNVRKALQRVAVDVCAEPIKFLSEWVSLYDNLIKRHGITGMTRFSKDAFTKQLGTPGIIAFRAGLDDKTVGMLLWYIQGDVAYYHLGAYTMDGYQQKASFALFWRCMKYFSAVGVKWLSLGAGAGVQGDDVGLTRFKSGWATGTRTTYFCGRIFDHQRYNKITAMRQAQSTEYFPAYRAGEFI